MSKNKENQPQQSEDWLNDYNCEINIDRWELTDGSVHYVLSPTNDIDFYPVMLESGMVTSESKDSTERFMSQVSDLFPNIKYIKDDPDIETEKIFGNSRHRTKFRIKLDLLLRLLSENHPATKEVLF